MECPSRPGVHRNTWSREEDTTTKNEFATRTKEASRMATEKQRPRESRTPIRNKTYCGRHRKVSPSPNEQETKKHATRKDMQKTKEEERIFHNASRSRSPKSRHKRDMEKTNPQAGAQSRTRYPRRESCPWLTRDGEASEPNRERQESQGTKLLTQPECKVSPSPKCRK